eukprot:587452-Hanusia_phi.AAC.6
MNKPDQYSDPPPDPPPDPTTTSPTLFQLKSSLAPDHPHSPVFMHYPPSLPAPLSLRHTWNMPSSSYTSSSLICNTDAIWTRALREK